MFCTLGALRLMQSEISRTCGLLCSLKFKHATAICFINSDCVIIKKKGSLRIEGEEGPAHLHDSGFEYVVSRGHAQQHCTSHHWERHSAARSHGRYIVVCCSSSLHLVGVKINL